MENDSSKGSRRQDGKMSRQEKLGRTVECLFPSSIISYLDIDNLRLPEENQTWRKNEARREKVPAKYRMTKENNEKEGTGSTVMAKEEESYLVQSRRDDDVFWRVVWNERWKMERSRLSQEMEIL